MNKTIRNLGLTSIVLGAVSLTGCSTSRNNEQNENRLDYIFGLDKPIIGVNLPRPKVIEGPYIGMEYTILNEQIAKEQGINKYIEVSDPNSERKIKVIYNPNGSVKNLEGDLPYNAEAIRKIIEKDTHFKSNAYVIRR